MLIISRESMLALKEKTLVEAEKLFLFFLFWMMSGQRERMFFLSVAHIYVSKRKNMGSAALGKEQ